MSQKEYRLVIDSRKTSFSFSLPNKLMIKVGVYAKGNEIVFVLPLILTPTHFPSCVSPAYSSDSSGKT